jgi:hypothetical protein
MDLSDVEVWQLYTARSVLGRARAGGESGAVLCSVYFRYAAGSIGRYSLSQNIVIQHNICLKVPRFRGRYEQSFLCDPLSFCLGGSTFRMSRRELRAN